MLHREGPRRSLNAPRLGAERQGAPERSWCDRKTVGRLPFVGVPDAGSGREKGNAASPAIPTRHDLRLPIWQHWRRPVCQDGVRMRTGRSFRGMGCEGKLNACAGATV